MNEIGTFDILGPNMIGPSSSHTAGALRIAFIAGKMVDQPVTVRFVLYGSFARTYHGHGTDRALVGGILGYAIIEVDTMVSTQVVDALKGFEAVKNVLLVPAINLD